MQNTERHQLVSSLCSNRNDGVGSAIDYLFI